MTAHLTSPFNKYLIAFLLFDLLLGSCASAPKSVSEYEQTTADFAAAPREDPAGVEYEEAEFGAKTIHDVTQQEVERIVIKNASITIVVEDPSASLDAISRMADEMGGFVVSANLYQTELEGGSKVLRASVTIRVPAEQLNEALTTIKDQSEQDPLSESIESQDVTREYTDLKSRLRNLEKAEIQLAQIMEEADDTEEVLAVYNELVRVQEQIEVIKGQIQYYEQSAAMSAISVEILADEAVQPLTIGGWQPVGVAKSAIQALINSTKFIANALIWIIIFVVPVLLILTVLFGLPLYLTVRAFRRSRQRKKEKKASNTKEKIDGTK